MADSLYYETGYADQGYVQRYIDSGPIGGLYVEDQYVEDDYVVLGDSIEFTMTASADVIQTSASLSSSFSLSATGNGRIYVSGTDYTWDDLGDVNWDDWYTEVWDPTDFRIRSISTISVNGSKKRSGTANVSSAFSLTAEARISELESAVANLTSAFGLLATARTTLSANSTINSAFGFTADANILIKEFGAASLSSAFNISSTGGIKSTNNATIASAFTISTSAGIKSSNASSINSAFSIDATPTKRAGGVVDIDSIASLSAQARRIRGAASSISAAFGLTAQGFPFDKGNADLTAAFSITATPTRKRSATLKPPITYAGDRPAKIVTPFGSTLQILSNTGKFGTGSMRIQNSGDYIRISGDSDLYSGDFTAEMWINASNLTSIPNGTIWDIRTSSSNGFLVYVSYGSIGLMEGINIKALISAGFVNDSWNHIGIVRSGTNMKVFVNGTQKISATVTANNYSSRNTFIGSTFSGSTPMRSYFDEVRLYNQALYSSNFTPSSIAFVNDANTAALIHFEDYLLDDNGYIRSGDPGLLFKTDISTFANVIVGAVANINSAFTVDSLGYRKLSNSATSELAFSQSAIGTRTRTSTSAITTAFGLSAVGTYRFTVPPSRRIRVEPESNIAKMVKETRLYTLDSETRINIVNKETRGLIVEQETRRLNNQM